MANFIINIANLNIGVTSIYDYSKKFCAEFLTDAEPDFSVSTTEEKIDREIEISEFNPKRPYAESICLYREIAEIIPNYDRVVFHGASIEYEGNGYIFTAVSGTGKSTHIKLWQEFLGNDKVQIVNGDKPILHITDCGTTVYSTPYAGKEGWQNHSSAPLKAICVLRRGTENRIVKAKPSEVLTDVFKQVYRPYNAQSAVKTLELVDKLLAVPVFILECDISEQAVKVSFEALTGLSYDERKIQ